MNPRLTGPRGASEEDVRTAEAIGITVEEWFRRLEATRRACRREPTQQVYTLLAAGWTMELPASPDPEPMSFYWRRPPRRKGSKGMFFWSTQQAFNALQREAIENL